jgi:hypothetical protein
MAGPSPAKGIQRCTNNGTHDRVRFPDSPAGCGERVGESLSAPKAGVRHWDENGLSFRRVIPGRGLRPRAVPEC